MNDRPNTQYPQFKIHNRTGSVQVTLKPAYFEGETFETRTGKVRVMKPGHLMVEMANATGGVDGRGYISYDWANKVSMKLSCADIQKILFGLQGENCKIVHDPNKALGDGHSQTLPNSCLVLREGDRFGYFMAMNRGETKASCPLNDSDAATLRLLLSRAVVRLYGW